MNKKILAAAALAIVSGSAMADGAQLYGILDLSVQSVSNASSTNQNLTQMGDGLWLPSLWGIKGSEDLGDGMTAHFNLESNLSANTGATTSPYLFIRASNVGIKGDFGDITAGGRLDPLWIQSVAEQAMGVRHVGSAGIATLSTYQNPSGNYGSQLATHAVFGGNWLVYNAPQVVDNVNLSAGYQFGNQAGSTSGATGTYFGGTYAKNGLTVNVGAESQNNTANTARFNRVLIGGMYAFGDFTVEGQIMRSSTSGISKGTAGYTDAQIGQVGIAYKVSPKVTVGYQYVYVNDNAFGGSATVTARPSLGTLGATYSLSKRTSLYGVVENSQPANGAGLATGYDSRSANTTANSSLVAVGMFHTF